MDSINGVTCIKGEISSIMTLMRLNTRWANNTSRDLLSDGYQDDDDLMQAFRHLNAYLEGIFDLREVDLVEYLRPFHQVIVSDGASGPLTQAALSSLSKFALYGFLSAQYPGAQAGVALVAECITNCIFEGTDWESDEVIFMKLLELSALTLRCDASCLLTVGAAWDVYATCLNIHAQPRASKILRSEAETTLRDLTLTAFGRAASVRAERERPPMPGYGAEHNLVVTSGGLALSQVGATTAYDAEDLLDALRADDDDLLDASLWAAASQAMCFDGKRGIKALLCKITNTLCIRMDMTAKKQTVEGVKFALSLVNVALEAGGPSLGPLDSLVNIMRADVCRHLLRASQSDDLAVLSLALRVVFNLFVSIKEHMKVQLEVFLTSIHLRLLKQHTGTGQRAGSEAAVALGLAREELALESLLEFCREPSLMVDLYTNYDCDVTCTNLFASIIEALCTRAIAPAGFEIPTARGGTSPSPPSTRVHILNRLALDGVFAVLHSVATRIVGVDSAVDSKNGSANSHDDTGMRGSFDGCSDTSPGLQEHPFVDSRSESRDSLLTVPLTREASADVDDVDRWASMPQSPGGQTTGLFLTKVWTGLSFVPRVPGPILVL